MKAAKQQDKSTPISWVLDQLCQSPEASFVDHKLNQYRNQRATMLAWQMTLLMHRSLIAILILIPRPRWVGNGSILGDIEIRTYSGEEDMVVGGWTQEHRVSLS